MTESFKCDELQEKVKNIILSEDEESFDNRIITLRGFAGTGKTFTASKIIEELKEKYPKKRVGAFAPTASAMSNLKGKLPDGLGITFNTLSAITQFPISQLTILKETFVLKEDELENIFEYFDKIGISHSGLELRKEFSKDYRTGKVEESIVIIPNIELIKSELNLRFRKDMSKEVKEDTVFEFLDTEKIANNLENFDLIVIDEISMVNDEMLTKIEFALEILKIKDKFPKVLLCGDGGQLKQVNGNPNTYITDKPNDETIFELTKIYRSTDEIAKLSNLVRQRFPLKNLNMIRPNTVFETEGTVGDLILKNKEILQNSDCVISFTNEVIDKVNSFIRIVKGYANSSGLKVGEKLLVTKNSGRLHREIAFANGEQWTIKKIYDYNYISMLLLDIIDEFGSNDSVKKAVNTILETFELEEPPMILVLLKNKLGTEKKAWVRYDLTDKKMSFFDRTIAQDIDSLYKLIDDPTVFPCFVPCAFAYAMTVHKAQGSEFDNVVYIVSDKDLRIANISGSANNLSYTAITRAKNDIKIIYRTDLK